MTRDEAKVILALHRPAPAEPDPQLAEAMRIAATDLELKRWFEQQRDFNKTFGEQLRGIEPPRGLAEKIVSEKPRGERVAFWRREPVLAIAACLVLLLSLAAFWRPARQESFADFNKQMTSFALRTYQMDVVTNNETVVRLFLATHDAPADFPLTRGLEKLPVKGGGRLTWQEHPVSMMCFSLTNNQTAFMFVVDENSVRSAPATVTAGSRSSLNTISWVQNGKVYLLAAAETPQVLAQLAPQ